MTPVFDAGVETTDANCPFCAIADTFSPYDPLEPPSDHEMDPTRTSPASFVVLSTDTLVAFLDIMPLSRGHLLLCPRAHRPKLTDASEIEAAELGRFLRTLSRALARVTGVEDWNVVQNNGAAAAQVVMHMHYHLIPRPEIRASGRFSESFTMFGRGRREELDDDEAEALARDLREAVAEVLKEEADDRRKSKL
ncbi:HIT domain-containing protein [Verticillium alfalfae VaMs.102]|uniref:HIT domain-containing protein n=1 Tax=Verticillium alfalfae (strain VaMs.102 / ATCC MYA-4576 / FGSC 10136) TaxID=526221 RepID=C9S888_VERA1|nr:HIT domain-containing protein [Verticillium alfalfae VaMs.102]EEY15338.1 HIT domain-containing protein [Verticillium alfalfae VaMs.102]